MGSRAKHWVFTLNNYTQQEELDLRECIDHNDDVVYLVYGRETAPSTGTPHLQGFISFRDQVYRTRVQASLGPRAWFAVSRGTIAQASSYCKKSGDFVEIGSRPASEQGKRTDFDRFIEWCSQLSERPSERELIRSFPKLFASYSARCWQIIDAHLPEIQLMDSTVQTLRPWQDDLEQELDESSDQRKIKFMIDREGNKGKSWFTRYYLSKYPDAAQVLRVAKRDDLAFAIDPTKRIYFFDIPRSQMEFLQYSVLEMLKDRQVFSPKYKSTSKILSHCPHVIVFCNEVPDMRALSNDRYEINFI